MVWERLCASDDEVVMTVHAENAEMMMRIGEVVGRQVVGRELDDAWLVVQFAARHGKSTAEVDAILRRKIQFDPSFARKLLSEFAEVKP